MPTARQSPPSPASLRRRLLRLQNVGPWRGYNVRRTEKEGPERTEMARETDTTRLPDGREDRVIECPVCSNTMTTMTADGDLTGQPFGLREIGSWYFGRRRTT